MTLAEVFVFLLGFILFYVFVRQLRGNSQGRTRPLPPCLPSLPLIGSIPFIRDFANLPEQFRRKAEQLGPVFGFYIGRRYCLVLNGRDAIREALLKHGVPFADRFDPFIEKTYTNKNAKGLMMRHFDSDFKRYRQQTLSIMKEFGFGIKNVTDRSITVEVNALVSEIEDMKGQPFNPDELIKMSITNVISGFIYGRAFERTSTERQKVFRRIRECIDQYQDAFELALVIAPITRFIPFYGKCLKDGAKAHEELMKILERELEMSLNDEGETSDCFVKRYVSEEGPHFDREQLMYTIRDLIVAGPDTTSITILWCLVLLANNPSVQKRVRNEIDGVVPRERLPSIDDKAELVYLEAVVLETMRIRTLAPFAETHVTLTDTEINGYFVSARTMVLPNLYSVHMDPKTWSDPNEFKPERFLDSNNCLMLKDHIMPFSIGKRSCPGEVLARHELFVFLGALVQRFIIEPPTGLHKVDDTAGDMRGIVKPSPTIQLRLIPRQLKQ